MRLLRMMAVVAVAALVAVGPTSTALASTSAVTTEDKIHVENLTVLVFQDGGVEINGLVVCDFASNPDYPDDAEVGASLTQHGVTDYSNGDFVRCGGPLAVAPLGGTSGPGLIFKPGRALLHLTFQLCGTSWEDMATVCGSYSYDGYIMIRKG